MRDWQDESIDVAMLEYMAEQCPMGREVEFVLGLHRLGFPGDISAYRNAVLSGLAKRFKKDDRKALAALEGGDPSE